MIRLSRRRRTFAVILVAALAAAGVGCSGSSIRPGMTTGAQAANRTQVFQSGQAILLRGPFRSRGIPFLSPNVLPYWFAQYELPGARSVRVYFQSDIVLRKADWAPHACGAYQLYKIGPDAKAERGVYFYTADGGWSLFFQFSGSEQDPCPFVEAFIPRFLFFYEALYTQKAYGHTESIPFPAVLRLP